MDLYDRSLQVKGVECGRQVLFTAKSFLSDRIVPAVEEVVLPGTTLPGGTLTYSTCEDYIVSSSRDAGRLPRFIARARRKFRPVDVPGILIDFRLQFPGNWAHTLNSHLPLALFLRDQINTDAAGGGAVTILLDSDIPDYISNLFGLFGFDILKLSCDVSGKFRLFRVTPWSCLRSISRKFVTDYFHGSELAAHLQTEGEVPDRVFLSRRKTRVLSNEREVESFLGARGYTTVYPEDLSAAGQLRLFMKASDIVAVHGAGLGPLLYRAPGVKPLRLVELLSPGHMTNYYRTMAAQVGAKWVGVRGRIEARHLKGAYRFEHRYTQHSLSPFRVDLESMETALAYLGNTPDTQAASPNLLRLNAAV